MTPPSIETSTDARSKSRVELAPTMPCKKEEDQRSTREEPFDSAQDRLAYVREKWVPPAPEHQLERKNVCTIASCVANVTYSKGEMQKPSMLII